nr:hypothetical protein [Tanacetum cinerariifolium]
MQSAGRQSVLDIYCGEIHGCTETSGCRMTYPKRLGNGKRLGIRKRLETSLGKVKMFLELRSRKNGKREKARKCRRPITVKKAEKPDNSAIYKVGIRRVVPTNYDPEGEMFLIASRFPKTPLACAFFIPRATMTDCSCSKGSVEDKILVPKPPKNYARCARCGHPVNGPYCQGCTLLREKLGEDLVTYFQNFQNTSESSDGSTNVVNAPREPFVVKQDHGVNPSHIDECAHIGYNCPPKVPIISNPKPCNQTMNNEPPQTLPSFDSTCYSDKEISVPCVSKPNFVDESSNIFNQPPQPPIYSCEFCGSNAQYGHYCTPQAPFINPEPGYSQDFNFPQDIHDFQQQKFNRYSFFETPKVLLLAWDRVSEIKDAFENKQNKPEDIQELFRKLLDDLQNIHEELAEFINSPGWNHEVIKSSVEDLVLIPSEFKGIPDTMCDVHLVNNPTSLEAKDHFEIVINSNDDYSSSDDDSLYYENIEYVKASPHDSEFVRLEVEKIVIPEDEEIEDDNLPLRDNPTPSSEFLTKSSSTSPKSFLEETNT